MGFGPFSSDSKAEDQRTGAGDNSVVVGSGGSLSAMSYNAPFLTGGAVEDKGAAPLLDGLVGNTSTAKQSNSLKTFLIIAAIAFALMIGIWFFRRKHST